MTLCRYLNDWNSFPLTVNAFEPCEAEAHLNWASINTTRLQELMRVVCTPELSVQILQMAVACSTASSY